MNVLPYFISYALYIKCTPVIQRPKRSCGSTICLSILKLFLFDFWSYNFSLYRITLFFNWNKMRCEWYKSINIFKCIWLSVVCQIITPLLLLAYILSFQVLHKRVYWLNLNFMVVLIFDNNSELPNKFHTYGYDYRTAFPHNKHNV